MPTSGDSLPARGEVWWIRADKRRPAIIVQSDSVIEVRVRSFLVVPLTSRLHLGELPGNVRLEKKLTGLSKASVANVYALQKVLRQDLLERSGKLGDDAIHEVEEGLRLVLDL